MYVMYLVSLSYAQVIEVGNEVVYKRISNVVYDIKILLLVGLSYNTDIRTNNIKYKYAEKRATINFF